MKLSTKPISSPGRTDKFPPPLMRFLRNNAASRSRGRSRSKSLFLRKKNTAIETQEPSSPKVTCMGQVRVKRASKKERRAAATSAGASSKCRCRCWLPISLFFHRLLKPFSTRHCKCQPNCGFFQRKKPSKSKSKVLEGSNRKTEFSSFSISTDEEELEIENRVKANAFVSNSDSSSTPPRNALLLTRCRSAPYSSSSLASRFWGSPIRNEKTELESENVKPNENDDRPSSVSEEGGLEDAKLELKLRSFKELEDSLREKMVESEKGRELKRKEEETEGDSSRPLVLTRCKSEPARTAQKLDVDVNGFWRKTRLGFADSCFPHGL